MNIDRINELSKFETLKKQFACLLFMHHKNTHGELSDGKYAAYKAAEEFLKKLYPFVVLSTSEAAKLIGYIATNWPNDQTVFEHYLLLKEAEAQGEFYPNKAQFICAVTNMIDTIDEEIKSLSKRTKRYKELKSLRESTLANSKLLHDLMSWNF